MTDQELYQIIINDDKAVGYIENNDYKRLYFYILAHNSNVKPNELTNLLINAGIDLFEDGEVFALAYSEDKSLKAFDFSKITKIDKLAFNGTGLTSANLKTVKEIEAGAFFSSDLTEVYLSSGTVIGDSAFANCKFTEIYIPDNIALADDVFRSCSSLETVVLDGSNISAGVDTFGGCRNIDTVFVTSNNTKIIDYVIRSSKKKDILINIITVPDAPYDEDSVIKKVKYWTSDDVNVTVREV